MWACWSSYARCAASRRSSLIAIDIGQGEPLTGILCPTILVQVTGLPWTGQTYPNTCDLGLAPSSFYQPVEDEWDTWVYDASVKYRLSDDTMVYVRAASGYRPGGTQAVAFAPSYDSDSLVNYEIGLKTTFLDGRARVNVAAYHIDWKDIQLTAYTPDFVGYTVNGGYAQYAVADRRYCFRLPAGFGDLEIVPRERTPAAMTAGATLGEVHTALGSGPATLPERAALTGRAGRPPPLPGAAL